jgi:hypothetical protein
MGRHKRSASHLDRRNLAPLNRHIEAVAADTEELVQQGTISKKDTAVVSEATMLLRPIRRHSVGLDRGRDEEPHALGVPRHGP